jgi:hypothetical protein
MTDEQAKEFSYRGFAIRIMVEGTGFRPHWSESIESKWQCGHFASTVDLAELQAKKHIDLRYDRESAEIIRKLKLVLKT